MVAVYQSPSQGWMSAFVSFMGLAVVGALVISLSRSLAEEAPPSKLELLPQVRDVGLVRKEYLDRVFNDLLTIEGATGRAKLALERKNYGEAYNAIVSADTVARGLYEAFPLAHFAER